MIIDLIARARVIQVITEESQADAYTTIVGEEREVFEFQDFAHEMIHDLCIFCEHIIVAVKRFI